MYTYLCIYIYMQIYIVNVHTNMSCMREFFSLFLCGGSALYVAAVLASGAYQAKNRTASAVARLDTHSLCNPLVLSLHPTRGARVRASQFKPLTGPADHLEKKHHQAPLQRCSLNLSQFAVPSGRR